MGVRAILLVEDNALERFISFVLRKLGFSRHEIRVRPYPAGLGSAKKWVERQYPVEVREHRRQSSYQRVSLVVGTDADQQAVQQRFEKLADELADSNLDARGGQERIVILVPKWNVETWIRWLIERDVDENTDAKYMVDSGDFKRAATDFVRYYHQSKNREVNVLPSMRIGFSELDRLAQQI